MWIASETVIIKFSSLRRLETLVITKHYNTKNTTTEVLSLLADNEADVNIALQLLPFTHSILHPKNITTPELVKWPPPQIYQFTGTASQFLTNAVPRTNMTDFSAMKNLAVPDKDTADESLKLIRHSNHAGGILLVHICNSQFVLPL